MALAGYAEHLPKSSANATRVQRFGAVFNGYVGIMYDHGYTPMTRDDHYGYFDGSSSEDSVTGDNVTYSIQFYNLVQIHTAAMRYIRYLSLSSEQFSFDLDAIGVHGLSKGGWMSFLGEEDPYSAPPRRIYPGHHGETRYENGETETVGVVDGGEEQPWLTYNGEEIDARANLIYCSCGGTMDSITPGHVPTFISCNTGDGSYYTSSNSFVSVCRSANVPTLWLEANNGHTYGHGIDPLYGVDVYKAFFDFAGYWLKGDAIKVVYISADMDNGGMPTYAPFVIQFDGVVEESELAKITLKGPDGVAVEGFWTQEFGGTRWTFHPDYLMGDTTYTVTVPATLKGNNGVELGEAVSYSVTTGFEKPYATTRVTGNRGEYITLTLPQKGDITEFDVNKYLLRIYVENDAVNTLGAYLVSGFNSASPDTSAIGECVGSVTVNGRGYYEIDITSCVGLVSGSQTFLIKAEKDSGVGTVFSCDLESGLTGGLAVSKAADSEILVLDGSKVLKVGKLDLATSYPNDYFYNNINAVTIIANHEIIGHKTLTEDDNGRRFTVSFRVYDTTSRYLNIYMTPATSKNTGVADYYATEVNIKTKANEWVNVSFSFDIHEPGMFGANGLINKSFFIRTNGYGTEERPIYFDDFRTTETVTDVDFSSRGVELICTTTEQRLGPLDTRYGAIPEAYASAEDYPFILFEDNGDGSYTFRAAENNIFMDSSPLMVMQREFKGVIYMRRNFTVTDRFTNVNFIAHGLVFDMNGNTLNCNAKDSAGNDVAAYYGCIKRATNASMTFINGRVVLNNAPFVTVASTSSKGTGYGIDFTFRNIEFVLAEGASTEVLTVEFASSAVVASSDIVFENCTYDISAGVPTNGITLFTSGHSSGKLETTVSVRGGEIIANGPEGVSLARLDEGGSLSFDSLYGRYTTLSLPASSSAPNWETTLDGGVKGSFTYGYRDGERDVFALLPTELKGFVLYDNITLYSDLIYNLYIPTEGVLALTVEGVSYDLASLKLSTAPGVQCYVVPTRVAVNEAGKDITLSVSIAAEGRSYTVEKRASIIDYLVRLIEDNSIPEATTLAKDILSYIRAAYVFAEGDSEVRDRIDGIIGTDYDAANMPTEIEKRESTEGLYSAAMQLGASPAFLLYIGEGYPAEQFEIRVDGGIPETEIVTNSEGRTYIKVTMYAYAMAEVISYTIDGTDISGEYNIKAYYEFARGESEALANLTARLWRYAESARAYRDAIAE